MLQHFLFCGRIKCYASSNTPKPNGFLPLRVRFAVSDGATPVDGILEDRFAVREFGHGAGVRGRAFIVTLLVTIASVAGTHARTDRLYSVFESVDQRTFVLLCAARPLRT